MDAHSIPVPEPGPARPAAPRARGAVRLEARAAEGATRLGALRQEGSLRALFPRPRPPLLEAVLLNTAGGLTAGDAMRVEAAAGPGARLAVTTQAAERAYRASGPGAGAEPARADTRLSAGAGARLHWLPQETILFEGCRLRRSFEADLDPSATLLAVEPLVLGRRAGGERLRDAALRDGWRVRRGGRLVLADALRLEGDLEALMDRAARGGGARALATLLVVGPPAESALARVREGIAAVAGSGGVRGGASLVREGVLAARILAPDGYALRRALVPIIVALAGALPRVWTL